ncbi:ATP-binding protein [Streptomyces sp. WAC05374]|uniref:ATP-binding protein n=1 Tax=Streptomyces sp. WAC05374 TaxID=2487420 RepID=UPI000F88D1BC|nr:ATP-binding protein [Streptomyces sp. WAC05374]RST10120.1 ATP-binding protein [Streptomyces sp. WAC05374]TDF37917.1 ATP-binding protein [Streptomyces sp. WAC05374]TDF52773.1 ATP-binding protein [Streptomyces sp. WAC05374]TDF54192.1 ATP-binding protein [Streptomyces sp. WAC05374]
MGEPALEHLRIRLADLHRALRAAVERQARLAARLTRPDLTPYCVTDEQVDVLLGEVHAFTDALPGPEAPPRPEPEAERELRRRTSARGAVLPLDALATRFGLTRAEQDALLLVAAPELDRGYERIYAYIVDNLNRRLPSVELLVTVGALNTAGSQHPEAPVSAEDPGGGDRDTGASARLALRRALGPAGPLRRYGLLRTHGESAVELAQELVLGPGVLDFLLGWGTDAGLLGHDPGEVPPPDHRLLAPHLASDRLTRLGRALATGGIDLAGLWGSPPDGQMDAVQALARAAGTPLRTLTGDPEADLRMAGALGAVLWVPTDDLLGEQGRERADHLSAALLRSRVPVCLTGLKPWRPAPLLAARAYAELTVPAPGFTDRRAMWSAALPDLNGTLLEDLAVRYRMSGGELRAVASVADAGARLAGNGQPEPVADHVEPAIATVTRGRSGSAVRSIAPRRTVDDLVLPDVQFQQILEIASAFRAWPRISETWGFARRSAHGGVKALFTGEPGTGKTMSAEIVTGMLGLELLKVDLAQVVSKWVGETEKNMETAFRQAEESHAVLLFDEADALFGKRGDVKHGTDRYANMEVGYLLQRLEASDGLVILTSNLKDNIDPAFTRRFHFVVHFPRPGTSERRRLWRLAFPDEAPLAPNVDLDALARLDMTGAGITAAARTAALAAADSGGDAIHMRHVVRGVARQFQREARLLRPSELGPHAHLLDAAHQG